MTYAEGEDWKGPRNHKPKFRGARVNILRDAQGDNPKTRVPPDLTVCPARLRKGMLIEYGSEELVSNLLLDDWLDVNLYDVDTPIAEPEKWKHAYRIVYPSGRVDYYLSREPLWSLEPIPPEDPE